MKIVIIGNGILGLSIAFRALKDTNAKIVIVGPSDRPGGATPAAAAMLNSFAELEHGGLESDESQEYFAMSYLATQMWPNFERELIDYAGDRLPTECSSCQVLTGGCFAKGTYVVNNATSNSLEDLNYKAILDGLKDFNEQYHDIDPALIPNYLPEPRSRALKAVFIPNEGWLNPKIVLKKLDNILNKDGRVSYINDTVIDLDESNSQIKSAQTFAGEKIEGDVFVLANGFGVSKLLSKTSFSGLVQPVLSSVGVSLEIKAIDANHTNVIRSPNRGGGCGIYTAPYFKGVNDSKNHILVGASSVTSIEPRVNGRIVSIAHLLESSIKEINQNFYNAELISTNVGNRPITLDQYPLLGGIEQGSNLYLATGTKRDGFHLAPLISEIIIKAITSGKSAVEYQSFLPNRKVIRNISRKKAIDNIVASKMNESYQHGYVSSSIYQAQQLEADWRRIATEVHDQAGAHEWGIPVQMFAIYREVLANPEQYKELAKYIPLA